MPEPKDNAPLNDLPREEDQTILETLRSDVEAMKASIKEEVVTSFRDELKKLSEPKQDKIPAPEVNRQSDVRVIGHASDILYRGLPEFERAIRNPRTDELTREWIVAVRNQDREYMRRYAAELNDLFRANELAEGTASATGGIGSGTGADLIPTPVASIIAEYRNRAGKVRQRAQVFTSPNQTLRVPRHSRMVAEMVAEGSSAGNSGHLLDTILLTKKKMQIRWSVTDEMLADTPFMLVNFLTRRAGAAMGQLEDVEFCTKVGSGASITQALEAIGGENRIQTVNAFGLLGTTDIARLSFSLPEQYTENATFAGNSTALTYLTTLTDGNGRPLYVAYASAPLIVGDQIAGNQATVFNRPVIQLPFTTSGTLSNKADIWLGDFKEYAILDGGGFELKASEHVEFNNGNVVFKVSQRIDGAVLIPEAFTRVSISGTV